MSLKLVAFRATHVPSGQFKITTKSLYLRTAYIAETKFFFTENTVNKIKR